MTSRFEISGCRALRLLDAGPFGAHLLESLTYDLNHGAPIVHTPFPTVSSEQLNDEGAGTRFVTNVDTVSAIGTSVTPKQWRC